MFSIMSLMEMKRVAVELPEAERRELAAFLLQLGRERSPAWQQEMTHRMRDMDAGKKITQADFEQRIGFNGN